MPELDELRALARRGRWRSDQARWLIDAWRRDGRPLADFAAHIGCEYERLRRWTKRVEPAPQFIELRAAAPARPLEVVVGEVTIRVPPGFDASTLRQLLKVLAAC